MPSTRKQKAKEKRSRQSDVMSDIENLDVMLGNYQRENEGNNDDVELDHRSIRRDEIPNGNDNEFRTFLNINPSENSCLTVETSKAISSEISSQMSKKFEEKQTSLNSQISDVINSAIETRVLPSIKNAVKSQNLTKNTNLDLRSDGPHPSNSSQGWSQKDLRSNRPHRENAINTAVEVQNEFPRLFKARSDQINHYRENSVDSHHSDDEDGYDTHLLQYR